MESDLRGISVNRFLEEAVQRELSSASRPSVSLGKTDYSVSNKLIDNKDASTDLFKTVEPFLDKEKIDIFRFTDSLKRFLVGIEGALNEIRPYLKQESNVLVHCMCDN
jgi:protein-tyrosine phosphatase